MSFTLGFQPERLTVKLSRFSDFFSTLVYDDGDPLTVNAWPLDAVIELRFYPTDTALVPGATWPADFSGDEAMWHKVAADVASEVLDAGNHHARLFYSDSDGVIEWGLGEIRDVN